MDRARPDLYRVLQVDPAANPLVIQAAYRALAQIFHPDLFGDEDEMKKINAAWEVLGDPRRRREYDIERAGRHKGAVDRQSMSAQPAWASTPSATQATAAGLTPRTDDHAGPPQGTPFGPVLRFGRYDGWTLGQVASVDRPWLEWLRRAPAGRALKDEIDAVLRSTGLPAVARRRYERDEQLHSWPPGAPTKLR